MTDIVWEDPPEHALEQRRATPYTEFAAALRARPGQWARVPGDRKNVASAKGTMQNLKRGRMTDFRKTTDWDFAIHGTQIWARYIGKEGEDGGEGDTPALPRGSAEQLSKKIRAWGQANGHELSEQGRLPRLVIEAYQRAHPHQVDAEQTDELLDEADHGGA